MTDKAILIKLDDPKTVYAIPARPKPREPWYKENAFSLLIIGLCWLGMIWVWME